MPKSNTLRGLMGVDPATINVKEVCPDMQLPEWIGQFQKGEFDGWGRDACGGGVGAVECDTEMSLLCVVLL